MDKVIAYTVTRHLDKVQLAFDYRLYAFFLDKLNKKYGQAKPIKIGKKFIYQYRAGGSLIELISWGRDSFKSAIIVHDPDDDAQRFFTGLADYFSLSQVEIAWDFHPQDPKDLYLLKCALAHKVVLRHGRKNAFKWYKSKDKKASARHASTAYLGNKGNVRHAPKGVRIYTKPENQFVRLELNLNRPAIRRKKLALPININDVNLYDFIFVLNSLDSGLLAARLVKAIAKKIGPDPLTWVHIKSFVSCISCDQTVSQQISTLREMLPEFGNRVSEFFQEAENILDGRIAISHHDIP
jgi:hypothetical protein